MAGQESGPQENLGEISEFGFRTELEKLGAIAVLEQIRDSGQGNGNLTIDQVLHLIELDIIAKDLSKNSITPNKDILIPSGAIDSLDDNPPSEVDFELEQAPIENVLLIPTTAGTIIPPSDDNPTEAKRRVLRPAKVHIPVKFKDSRHISIPPVPRMGSGPIARNVPPPPVRSPEPKE